MESDGNFLFSEFDKVSAKQWKQKIQFDLKGADYNEVLVWESLEGIKVKPFYHEDDLQKTTSFSISKDHGWQVSQQIIVANPKVANQTAHKALSSGAQSLIFTIGDKKTDWKSLFDKIDLGQVPIHFDFQFLDVKAVELLMSYLGKTQSKIYLNFDIIGNLARTGNWYDNFEKDHKTLENAVVATTRDGCHPLGVDMALYQNAGATCVQQLAYGLAHANEYLNHFDSGHPITFKVAIGGNYFFEIAKIKALRWLWQTLASAYSIKADCHILAIPSKRNKTLYDYNVNLLRSTTECMSAVLGGADTVCNLPYDDIYHNKNEFGERISRNQLLVLKEESSFDSVAQAANGAYYIDSLTQQLAERALELFKQIEISGGFLSQLKKGIIQKKIKESAQKEQTLFDTGKLVLVGTNKYQNIDDRMTDDIERYPFIKVDKRKTLIPPIIEKRLAEAHEQERLKHE